MYTEWLQQHPLEKIALDRVIIPPATCRNFWNAVPDDVRDAVTYHIDALVGTPWPQIPAVLCLDFRRTGNRQNMEQVYFAKRSRLSKLVLAECIEHRGRFVDEILNGLQSIAEEAFWGVSAHYPIEERCDMPNGTRQTYIDLFAAETASLLTWAKYLLADELMRVAPELVYYLETELDRRIKTVFLNYNGFWWMGYDRTKRAVLNNWTPWITSNLLTVFLLSEPDFRRKRQGIAKCLEIQDAYLRDVPQDGGIDEGTSYWEHSVGAVLETVWLLDRASGGELAFYQDNHLDRMVNYLPSMYVGNGWVLNFNDASPKQELNVGKMWSYGQRSGNGDFCSFAATLAHTTPLPYDVGNLHGFLCVLPYIEAIRNATPKPLPANDVYYPNIQIVTAASTANDRQKGFFFAVKGHHNAESHNHDDVGSYILYCDGQPLVIDLGSGVYTAKTFSNQRYELFNCQSNWHNLPVINGAGQREGKTAAAQNFTYQTESDRVYVAMDLAHAYVPEAGLIAFSRKVLFERGERGSLTVQDYFNFSGDMNAVSESIIVRADVEIGQGRVRLQNGDVCAEILFDPGCISAVAEPYTDDESIPQKWGGPIYRISLRALIRGHRFSMTYKIQ